MQAQIQIQFYKYLTWRGPDWGLVGLKGEEEASEVEGLVDEEEAESLRKKLFKHGFFK